MDMDTILQIMGIFSNASLDIDDDKEDGDVDEVEEVDDDDAPQRPNQTRSYHLRI